MTGVPAFTLPPGIVMEQPLVPPRPLPEPVAAALAAVEKRKAIGDADAADVYRRLALKLVDGAKLNDKESDALAGAMTRLGLVAADLRADIAAVVEHRAAVAALGDADARAAAAEKERIDATSAINAAAEAERSARARWAVADQQSRIIAEQRAEVERLACRAPRLQTG